LFNELNQTATKKENQTATKKRMKQQKKMWQGDMKV